MTSLNCHPPRSARGTRQNPLALRKFGVDRGKANIGDLIEGRQRLHDQSADHVAGDFGLVSQSASWSGNSLRADGTIWPNAIGAAGSARPGPGC